MSEDEPAAWPEPVPAGLADEADFADGDDADGDDADGDVEEELDPVEADAGGTAEGVDLARQALAAARAQPDRPRRRRRQGRGRRMAGPGADSQDPTPLGALVERMVADRDWQRSLSDAGVFSRWPELVGADIAAHCRPERLTAGSLLVIAESTAWATQLRLLVPAMLARLAERLGAGVVTAITVQGPSAPSWQRGGRRVRGRGPRDTYG